MNITSRDSRRSRPSSVRELAAFFEIQTDRKELRNDDTRRSCNGNSDINRLKDGHLVSDRRKLFEKMDQNFEDQEDKISSLEPPHEETTSPRHPTEVIMRQREEQDRHSFEHIQKVRRSVMDTIIKYIQEGVSDDENEDDSTPLEISEGEIEECEIMMEQLPRSWSSANLAPTLEGDDEEKEENEITKCMEEVSGEFNDLVTLTEEMDVKEMNTRGNFVKNNRSWRRRNFKKNSEDVVYSYQRIDSSESSQTEGESDKVLNGDLCECEDIFGSMTDINEFIVEAYNRQTEDVLYKLTLQREAIPLPVLGELENVTIPAEESLEVDHIYDKIDVCDHEEPTDDNTEYVNLRRNAPKKEHVYENWVINDETLEGSYYDKDLNPRITITCESFSQKEDENSLDVSKRFDSQLSSPTPKKRHIIDELRETERKYLNGLEYAIHEYLKHFTNHPDVRHVGVSIKKMFGNIEDIFRAVDDFYKRLIDCGYSVECIAKLFIDSGKMFLLCSDYMRNKSQTQHMYEQYYGVLSERQRQLNDKKTCDSYLLTPVQRPTRYKLLLENLSKDLKKHGEHYLILEEAIQFIDKHISEANRLLAIDSIRGCPFDLTTKGPLLLKDSFNIKRKYKSFIFLFRDVIVFTTESKTKQDTFEYKDSISSLDLSLKHQTNSNAFVLIDFPKSKRESSKSDEGTYRFEIEAVSQQICAKWVEEIRNILWVQLATFKNLQAKKSITDEPSPKKDKKFFYTSLDRKKKSFQDTSRTSVFYISDDCQ